nr:MAG TPA: hypothetical protein [Caudoviricetes sp.]
MIRLDMNVYLNRLRCIGAWYFYIRPFILHKSISHTDLLKFEERVNFVAFEMYFSIYRVISHDELDMILDYTRHIRQYVGETKISLNDYLWIFRYIASEGLIFGGYKYDL